MALDYLVIGERIKKARMNKKFTQEYLSEKLDISTSYLSRVECGDALINLKRLSQICDILDVTEGQILNGTSSNSFNYLSNEFSELLASCSPEKKKLIFDIATLIAKDN